MEEPKSSSQEQVTQAQSAQELADLDVREDGAEVRGGASGDPDEGGQVFAGGTVRGRLAGNSNETIVEDEA
jgi:hypothetical protein